MSLQEIEPFCAVMSEDIKFQLERYSALVEKAVQYAQDLVVKDMSSAQRALNFAAEAKGLYDKIEVTRKDITCPAREFVSAVNTLAKTFTTRLGQVRSAVGMKIDNWKLNESTKQEEEFSDDLSTIRAYNASAIEKTEWKYEITCKEEIPPEYLTINDSKVQQDIKNGLRNIPGLRIYSEQKTIIRRKNND